MTWPTRLKRSFYLLPALLCCLSIGMTPPARAQQRQFDEYQVKAVFLFNLTCFVSWPPTAFASPRAPFRIVVYGRDPFGPLLDQVMAGETAQGRPIVIERVAVGVAVPLCQLLLVSADSQTQAAPLLDTAAEQAVLTVGESPGFIAAGGLCNLRTRDRRIQLQINAAAHRHAERHGLVLSAKLLQVATLIDASGEPPL
jgi:hypothetical protein